MRQVYAEVNFKIRISISHTHTKSKWLVIYSWDCFEFHTTDSYKKALSSADQHAELHKHWKDFVFDFCCCCYLFLVCFYFQFGVLSTILWWFVQTICKIVLYLNSNSTNFRLHTLCFWWMAVTRNKFMCFVFLLVFVVVVVVVIFLLLFGRIKI